MRHRGGLCFGIAALSLFLGSLAMQTELPESSRRGERVLSLIAWLVEHFGHVGAAGLIAVLGVLLCAAVWRLY